MQISILQYRKITEHKTLKKFKRKYNIFIFHLTNFLI